MYAINQNILLNQLQKAGTVSQVGATVINNDANFYFKMTLGNIGEPYHAGYFATDKAIYKLIQPFTEQSTLIYGEVELTNEDTGKVITIKKGDSWFIEKGTRTIWNIKSDYFIKHYFGLA